jgi:RHS repeat-associated protein
LKKQFFAFDPHNDFRSLGAYGLLQDDATDFRYNRARYYDAEIGRFISRDPIGIAGGINLYGYARNNAVNWVDVDGNNPLLWPIITLVAILVGEPLDKAVENASTDAEDYPYPGRVGPPTPTPTLVPTNTPVVTPTPPPGGDDNPCKQQATLKGSFGTTKKSSTFICSNKIFFENRNYFNEKMFCRRKKYFRSING